MISHDHEEVGNKNQETNFTELSGIVERRRRKEKEREERNN